MESMGDQMAHSGRGLLLWQTVFPAQQTRWDAAQPKSVTRRARSQSGLGGFGVVGDGDGDGGRGRGGGQVVTKANSTNPPRRQ